MDLWNTNGLALHEIKSTPIEASELDQLIDLAGSAQALFSKRARKYRELGLHERTLGEGEMRELLLTEYTFLKRPVLVLDDQIFVGNAKKVVEAAARALDGE